MPLNFEFPNYFGKDGVTSEDFRQFVYLLDFCLSKSRVNNWVKEHDWLCTGLQILLM